MNETLTFIKTYLQRFVSWFDKWLPGAVQMAITWEVLHNPDDPFLRVTAWVIFFMGAAMFTVGWLGHFFTGLRWALVKWVNWMERR